MKQTAIYLHPTEKYSASHLYGNWLPSATALPLFSQQQPLLSVSVSCAVRLCVRVCFGGVLWADCVQHMACNHKKTQLQLGGPGRAEGSVDFEHDVF